MPTKWEDNEAVQRLRDYLRIPTVHPDVDYRECVKFLKAEAESLGLKVAEHEFVPNKPLLVFTWEGQQPDMPSILLNSHMDVVPVDEDKWTYPPFDAVISEDGFIYARGAQDMKGIGMMQFEAVKKLKEAGVKLKRTVHLLFVPDEEIGGYDGMFEFSKSEALQQLNVGFGLDEGPPNESPNHIEACNGERTRRQFKIICRGEPGHGSIMFPNTAGEKLHYMINKFMTLRAQEKSKLPPDGLLSGYVTSINLTQISGGVQVNVSPTELTASFDVRVAPDVDVEEFDNMVARWCSEAGEGVTFEYMHTHANIKKDPQTKCLVLEGNEFWAAMSKAVNNLGIKMTCVTFGGATDSRYLRHQGIPMINFAPIMNSKLLVHAHDETIHVDVFLRGIDVMTDVVKALGNV
ncbi:unnamed protein product [Chrysodeixis includens]|uniref:N-acyl-aliphatic-L-amino acid amidohydrolase n=1 Tax=Chrysodeixis includens TaxID=689277 RepID=A0A9P0FWE7_CHRIL|nr:unnamed protein product [Chrysodeixis includens]